MKKYSAAIYGACALSIILVGLPACGGSKHKPRAVHTVQRDEATDIGAYVMSQEFVKDQLRCPSTAKFPWRNPAVEVNSTTWGFQCDFDAQNGFGAMVRMHYSCLMWYAGNDKWGCTDLVVTER